uniref:Uncharacterized protein n=1 Tax=Mycena chlorophos TaxID=658473 RepID=A0ABQ0M5S3_MYCCL|nr:predicted protein [Mycena chlorophos]
MNRSTTCLDCPLHGGRSHSLPTRDAPVHAAAVAKARRELAEQQLAEEQALEAAAATFLGVVLDDEGFDPRSQQHSKLFSSGDEFQSSAPKVPAEMPTLSHAEGIATLATAASATARSARPIPLERPVVATKSQMREEALTLLLARLDIALDDLDFAGDVIATDVDVERRAAQLKSAGNLLEEARDILERTKSSQRARSPEIVRLWQAAMDKAVELDNQITCIGALMRNDEEDREDGGGGDEPGQVYNTDDHFQNPVVAYNAITQVVILLAAVANIIIGVGKDPCNFLLDTIILIIRASMSLSLRPNEEFDAQQEQVLSEMPLTLDSAMRALKLDPKTTIYAACPSCHHTHPPKGTHRLTGDGVYPARCRNRVFIDKKGLAVACDTLLVETRHGKVRPIKPFVYHNLKDYLASTLSDPDIVAECNAACDQAWTAVRNATEKGNSKMSAEFVNNIFEAEFIRMFPGPVPNELFIQRGDRMRLAFEILVDFFNPHGLRKRGNHDSVGILALANLNLPDNKRYKPEFMWVSVILGPREPNHDQIGAYLQPVIDEFVEGWTHGIHLSRVGGSEGPVRVDLTMALTVNDLPATRKILGLAGVGSNHVCTICKCKGADNVHRADTEHPDWALRNREELFRWTCAWRDAASQAERDRIFKDHGVRWSELWRLPYWDPTRMGVVDTMHCILEGVVHYHCRRVLRIDAEFAKKKDSPHVAFDYDWKEYIHAECHPGFQLKSPEHIKKIYAVQAKLVQALADEEDDGEEEGIVEEVVIENDANKPTPKGNSGAISEREIEDQLALGNLRALRWVAHSLDLDLTGVTKRADYARILMVWRRTMPRKSNDENVRPKAINTDQLKFIQRVIADTATPSWVNGVPSNYGESSAGTIKADEWRVLSTIYLPIALVLLSGTGEEEDPRLRGMLDHSMALFSAVILVCRHVITEDRVAAYRHHLKEWVQGLEVHHPHTQIHARRPNIHMAFHIADFLVLFGPVVAWWSFPFERMIGHLQNINTNHRVGGQLEGIMTVAYARAANLRRWLRRSDCPELVHQFKAVFERAFGRRDAITSAPLVNDGTRASFTHNGVKFSRSSSNVGDSLVFYYPNASATSPIFGSIEKILSHAETTTFVIRRQAPLPEGSTDPFARYQPHFPASMYSSRLLDVRDTITPDQIISHAARFDYGDRSVVLNLSRS